MHLNFAESNRTAHNLKDDSFVNSGLVIASELPQLVILSHQWSLRYLTQAAITSMGSKNVQLESISTFLTFCAFQTPPDNELRAAFEQFS